MLHHWLDTYGSTEEFDSLDMKPVQQEYISILTLPTDTFCVCWKWFIQLFSLARTPFAGNYLLHTMQAQVQTPGFVLRRSEMLLADIAWKESILTS